MANQEKAVQSLTVNYLSLKQFRALQSTQSLKSDEVYTIKDLDMYTKDEADAKVQQATSGMLTEITWDNVKNKPNLDVYATSEKVKQIVSDLVSSAPEQLDTLKEIAEALNNDPHFASTMVSELGKKVNRDEYTSDLEKKATKTELAEKATIKVVVWGD